LLKRRPWQAESFGERGVAGSGAAQRDKSGDRYHDIVKTVGAFPDPDAYARYAEGIGKAQADDKVDHVLVALALRHG